MIFSIVQDKFYFQWLFKTISIFVHFKTLWWYSALCKANLIFKDFTRYLFLKVQFMTLLWWYLVIFTFPLRACKWTSTFEMWFIPSWTNRFKPHPHTHHLSGLTSSPSNNVACLLTLNTYRYDVKSCNLAFWLFQTLRYLWFNSKYLENQPS